MGLPRKNGHGGGMVECLKADYMKSRCEVRVGKLVSESFGVVNGLRQRCFLIQVFFSLYINLLQLDKLGKAEVEVKCKDQLILALLYADDMVMFAEDKEMLRRALVVLGEWCEEWSVKVNINKCGVMHMGIKGVKRSGQRFGMNGEVIVNAAEYKYLGCIVIQHVESRAMVDSRAKAGARALCAWLKSSAG